MTFRRGSQEEAEKRALLAYGWPSQVFVSGCDESEVDKAQGKSRQRARLTQQKAYNLGMETHCDLMIQPEVKAEKGERKAESADIQGSATARLDLSQHGMKVLFNGA